MQEQVAIVTGAGRGIGRAVAIGLAAIDYRVILVARNASELEQTRTLCPNAVVSSADVTDADAVEQVVGTTADQFGQVDAIVHCAGLAPLCGIGQMSVEQWRAVLDTNLSAAFYLCRAAWPIFERQGGGVVVNVSSEASRDPFDGFAAYGAAKAGLNLFGLSAAREGRKIGVRVHTVAPAAVETEMFRRILSPEQFSTEKTLQPQQVARVIIQCVTGDLRHTSGEVIYMHKEG